MNLDSERSKLDSSKSHFSLPDCLNVISLWKPFTIVPSRFQLVIFRRYTWLINYLVPCLSSFHGKQQWRYISEESATAWEFPVFLFSAEILDVLSRIYCYLPDTTKQRFCSVLIKFLEMEILGWFIYYLLKSLIIYLLLPSVWVWQLFYCCKAQIRQACFKQHFNQQEFKNVNAKYYLCRTLTTSLGLRGEHPWAYKPFGHRGI